MREVEIHVMGRLGGPRDGCGKLKHKLILMFP